MDTVGPSFNELKQFSLDANPVALASTQRKIISKQPLAMKTG